jgi:MFS family permease
MVRRRPRTRRTGGRFKNGDRATSNWGFMTSEKKFRPDRHFRLFWLGQTASNVGDAFGFVAMPLLVLDISHSVVKMGYVTAMTAVGQLGAAMVSGIVVDRLHRRKLMMACDAARMILYGTLPFVAMAGSWAIPLVCVVALLVGALSNLFTVGYTAAVSNLVDAPDVAAANGHLQATQALAYVAGSLLAGVVVAKFGPGSALGIDASSFALSAASLSLIVFRRDRAEQSGPTGGTAAELLSGIRFLLRQQTLLALTIFQIVVGLLGSLGLNAAVIDLVVFRLKTDFSAGGPTVGVCLSVAAVGAVGGAVLGALGAKRMGLGRICLVGTVVQGLGLLTGGLGGSVAAVTAAGFLWAWGLSFRSVGQISLRQQLTPDELLGRVVAASWTMIFVASAAGAVLVTQAAGAFGAARAMAVIGVLLVGTGAAGFLSPLARPRA